MGAHMLPGRERWRALRRSIRFTMIVILAVPVAAAVVMWAFAGLTISNAMATHSQSAPHGNVLSRIALADTIGLAAILVDSLTRLERLLGPDTPYMLWVHQRPADGAGWPAAHLHLHLSPARRAFGVARHLASAELGAGVFFDPVDPHQAAADWRAALS